MPQHIGYIALLVRDYDEAISYFIEKLGFTVAEDTDLGGGKRWVLVAPLGSVETRLVKGSICGPIALHRESD
jgi:catechol 2,3-dioxygenase-like lactoylglutathione lyase family enzyme